MAERVRTMAWERNASWHVRPASIDDVTVWSTRSEGASLIRPGVGVDPDLSWAAELAGRAAALLLIERLANGSAYVNALAVANEARPAGGFALMLSLSTYALQMAGFRQIVFTTDSTRREMIAFARRCGSRHLRQILRLQRSQ